jgi:hypothetical protein
MIKKTIEIDVNTSDAVKDVDKLTDSVKDLDKEAKGVSGKSLKGVGDGAKKAGKGVSGLSANFKALGGAIKATGIGLLVTALASLAEGLSQNERASKFFKTTFEAVSIVTQDFINFVIDNGGKVVDLFKDIFENPTKNIQKLGDAIKTNLIERFESFLETIGFISKAVKSLFEGDFQGALDNIKEAGLEVIDTFTGVDGTLEKATKTVTDYGNTVLDTAKKNIQLATSAEIASAQQALLVEQYDRQAEKLRQIRDNDLISIEERIKANNDLGDVLEKQEKAQLAEADAILASAQAQVNKNNNTENQVKLLEAQANKAGVLAQVEGFRSEQLTNENALIREKNELTQSGIESDTLRALNQKEFDASIIEDGVKRLEAERTNLETEREIEEERLQLKIDSFALGTQARLDAENELKDKLQEINQEIALNKIATDKQIVDNDKKADEEKIKSELAVSNTKKKLATTTLSFLSSVAEEGSALSKGVAVAQATINTFQGITSELATKTATPFEFGLKLANIASVTAIGFKSVKDILSTNATSASGGGASASGGSAPTPPPAFNLVGGSGVNQISDSLAEEQTPIQAFVVGSEVTNQQEIDNAQASSASLG